MPKHHVDFRPPEQRFAENSPTAGLRSGDKDVPPAYVVEVNSKSVGKVVAVLQEDFQFRVESNWGSVIPQGISSSGGTELLNVVVQSATGGRYSIQNKLTSRRIWKSTSPVIMNIPLKFEAQEDARREVLLACELLQRMVVPAEGLGKFLAPPGPSPFLLNEEVSVPNSKADRRSVGTTSAAKVRDFLTANQDRIQVSIGRALWFRSVIIRSAAVKFSPRFTRGGDPISATVDLVVETYEILSKQGLAEAYNGIGRDTVSELV